MAKQVVPKEALKESFLTTREFATLLGVSPDTLCRLAREGKLHPIRLGSRLFRWKADSLDAFTVRSYAPSNGGDDRIRNRKQA